MKYIDERRLRTGYLALFGMAVALMVGALLDIQYNDQRGMPWYVAGLAAVFVVALLYYLSSESILKDALNLTPTREARPVPAAAGPAARTFLDSIDIQAAPTPIRPTPLSAASAMPGMAPMMGRPTIAPSLSSRVAQARPSQAPTTMNVTIVDKPREKTNPEGEVVPRPDVVPMAPHRIEENSLPFEFGNHEFRLPRGAVPHGHGKLTPLETTRILCANCGLYFQVDLEKSRPIAVPCPRCDKELGLSGGAQMVAHVKLRCKHCGDFLQIPKLANRTANQCATCGQINA